MKWNCIMTKNYNLWSHLSKLMACSHSEDITKGLPTFVDCHDLLLMLFANSFIHLFGNCITVVKTWQYHLLCWRLINAWLLESFIEVNFRKLQINNWWPFLLLALTPLISGQTSIIKNLYNIPKQYGMPGEINT